MNRITRMLTVTGLGLFAGVAMGAGPAMAATNTGHSAVKSSTAAAAARPGDEVEGYYDSRDECRLAGRLGERHHRWDDWDCYPADGGFHHGDWVLVVDNNWDNGNDWDHGHNWHGGHNWHHGGFPHGGFPHGGFPHGGFPHGGFPHKPHFPHPKPGLQNNAGMPSRG
jgi:hypothetical protein